MEELPYLTFAGPVVEPGARRCGHYDYVHVVPKRRAMLAVDLSDVTLDAIADDRAADLARYGASQLTTLTRPPDPVADERIPHPFRPFAVYALVVFVAGKALTAWKTLWARHSRLITFSTSLWAAAKRPRSLGRKALAALLSSSSNHVSSARRGHAAEETVIAFPLDVGRLKSPLHSTLLRGIPIPPGVRSPRLSLCGIVGCVAPGTVKQPTRGIY